MKVVSDSPSEDVLLRNAAIIYSFIKTIFRTQDVFIYKYNHEF